MLQPKETDLLSLFLVLVVLPLVAYILLGIWSETARKKERISVLAQIAAEEAFRAEAMAAATVISQPAVPMANHVIHECARCYGPATTRCSRCKSVRYCSGKCQIIHWRQIHKEECQPSEWNNGIASPNFVFSEESLHENFILDESTESLCSESNLKEPVHEKIHLADSTEAPVTLDSSGAMAERRSIEKWGYRSSDNEILRSDMRTTLGSFEDDSGHNATCSNFYTSGSLSETYSRHKENEFGPRTNFGVPNSNETRACNMDADLMHGRSMPIAEASTCATVKTGCSYERTSTKRSNATKQSSHSPGTKMHKSAKSLTKVLRDKSNLDIDSNGHVSEVAKASETVHAYGGNRVANMGFVKMIGLTRLSKHDRRGSSEVNGDRNKKVVKMIFPYDEFVKFFEFEVFDLRPRGLVNCGNSCYANAVLQCLTCTKPLTVYLLGRSHSRDCRVKDWCLVCELEQHVMMLRESKGGPLSLSRILLHMRRVNSEIGNGSQEDAHEFLRLLVTSMQSICLERLGGESVVEPMLQETTFIQHTFGGRLRSKVKCLRCHHVSERHENIMDLTLEIYGWVRSLEDALTQFTSPEDLDGENMYRCGRCAAYVRAQKQLGIKEAPNVLTIVLKRFQEGSYGKINKCITFPEMLDMIPFMTGTDDIPPLYVLYAVVVHLDTLNASFSGHYVSYVKDLQGNWFRIDDTEVQPVPVSQVMSEGAYMLFYMRSCPRPAGASTEGPAKQESSSFTKHGTSRTLPSNSKHPVLEMPTIRGSLGRERPRAMDFSDATSSDWSLFTSSDDASFTTESTRDSFSAVDYSDACNLDRPFSSIFGTSYSPRYSYRSTVSCREFVGSQPWTGFVQPGGEEGSVLNSEYSGRLPPYRISSGGQRTP